MVKRLFTVICFVGRAIAGCVNTDFETLCELNPGATACRSDAQQVDGDVRDGVDAHEDALDSFVADAGEAALDATCAGRICGGECVDVRSDPRHCGDCDQPVHPFEACVGGRLSCIPGWTPCGDSGSGDLGCANIESDPANCGACKTRCASGNDCFGGGCYPISATACPGSCGTPGLGNGCYTVKSDPSHCGSCDTQCKATEFCDNGTCSAYVSAPGCATCDGCGACAGATSHCCVVYGATACAASCG